MHFQLPIGIAVTPPSAPCNIATSRAPLPIADAVPNRHSNAFAQYDPQLVFKFNPVTGFHGHDVSVSTNIKSGDCKHSHVTESPIYGMPLFMYKYIVR